MTAINEQFSRGQLAIITITILVASLLFVLDYSISSVILPYVIGDLGARYEQGTYIVTTFSIGNAFALPPVFFLLKYFGKRRLFIFSLLTFPIASLACGLTQSFGVLLFFRFILGVVSGPILPLALFILLDLYPKKYEDIIFGVWACTMISAPMIGPLIGGFLATAVSWRAVFLFMIPIGIIAALVIYLMLELEKEKEVIPLDLFGYFLLTVMSVTFQFMMDKGQQWDWHRSPLVLFLGTTFLLATTIFIVWNRYQENPILDFKLLKLKSFSLAILITMLTYSSFFGTMVIIPIWLETKMGYDAFNAGLANAPIGIIPFMVSPFVGYFMRIFSPRKLLFFSMCVFAAVAYWTTNFYVDIDLYHIQMSRLILGIGFAFYLAPLMTLSLLEVNKEDHSKALIFFHFVRVTSGAIGTAAFTTIWTRRTHFHREFLTEFVTPLNPYTKQFLEATKHVPFQIGKPLAVINESVNNQATVLALLDVFWAIMWCYIAAGLAIIFWWGFDKIKKILNDRGRNSTATGIAVENGSF
jgi:DHA2 family multidrug resistance protein